ncbi:L-2-hydroxyglutarate oxidase LhgO [bacterium HR39]|nr:L-2-hydroxyglutarate oxidase LhgO [bacterium HR39]
MLAYLGDAEDAGAALALHTPLDSAEVVEGGFLCRFADAEGTVLKARILVNSAGLWAPHLARRIRGLDPRHVPTPYFCKGSYFVLRGRSPFSHLIYPVPDSASLGIHVTLDLAGRCRFGPDAEWVEEIDYDVDPARAGLFQPAIRRYWPDLPDGALEPGYAGIRPRIVPPGAPPADFVVQGPAVHGIPGLVNLFGIESPGLTASAALAEVVARRLGLPPSEEFADLTVPPDGP